MLRIELRDCNEWWAAVTGSSGEQESEAKN